MMDTWSFIRVFVVLVVMVPKALSIIVSHHHQQQLKQSTIDGAFAHACPLLSKADKNDLNELLILSVCARGENYTLAGVGVHLADRSVLCFGTPNPDDPYASFTVGLAVIREKRVWPMEVDVCTVSDNIGHMTCVARNITLPGMEAAISGEGVVQATIHSKNATHILYEINLDYCSGQHRTVGGKSENLLWQRILTAKRQRRDLKGSQENQPNGDVNAEQDGIHLDDGASAEDTGKSLDLFEEEGRPGADVDNEENIQWIKKREPHWRQGSLGRNEYDDQDGNGAQEKRKWRKTGMQWMKKSVQDDGVHFGEDDDATEDEQQMRMDGYDDAESKRKWSKASPMGWMKRKWGKTAAMGWMKRNDDKRRWKNSGMQWTKK